jgi:outer membrane protein assembly factor BamB
MLVMGGNQLDAYDPQTGKQIWYLGGLEGGRTVTGPVAGENMVYVTRGMRGPLLGIELGDHMGKVSTEAIRWEVDRGTPDTPTPVLADGMLLTVTDDGIAHCYNASNGELHWRERLGGNFKASPVAADGHVYFLDTRNKCHVIQAADTFRRVAENSLNDETLSSIAIAGGNLLISQVVTALVPHRLHQAGDCAYAGASVGWPHARKPLDAHRSGTRDLPGHPPYVLRVQRFTQRRYVDR